MIKKLLTIMAAGLLTSVAIEAQSISAAFAKEMTRLDFKLDHASCPSCILKVRKALRATGGVVACDISLRKPYGGVVIYESGKTDPTKLEAVAHGADPNKRVVFSHKTEEPIAAVPPLLIPKINAMSEPKEKAAQ